MPLVFQLIDSITAQSGERYVWWLVGQLIAVVLMFKFVALVILIACQIFHTSAITFTPTQTHTYSNN